MRHLKSIEHRNRSYFIRIQIAVVCSLLLFVLLFRYWPDSWNNDGTLFDRFAEQELITPEMIIASQQVSVERVAPPVPRPVETLPDGEVVDMSYNLDVDATGLDYSLPYPEPVEEDHLVELPDRPPNVRRIVEPVMPSQARRENIRVEIEILFTVSAEGVVEEVMVVAIRKFNRQTGQFEDVDETGYGFREMTLHAARQWLFQPAQHEGKPVRSQTRQQFTFGNGS